MHFACCMLRFLISEKHAEESERQPMEYEDTDFSEPDSTYPISKSQSTILPRFDSKIYIYLSFEHISLSS